MHEKKRKDAKKKRCKEALQSINYPINTVFTSEPWYVPNERRGPFAPLRLGVLASQAPLSSAFLSCIQRAVLQAQRAVNVSPLLTALDTYLVGLLDLTCLWNVDGVDTFVGT